MTFIGVLQQWMLLLSILRLDKTVLGVAVESGTVTASSADATVTGGTHDAPLSSADVTGVYGTQDSTFASMETAVTDGTRDATPSSTSGTEAYETQDSTSAPTDATMTEGTQDSTPSSTDAAVTYGTQGLTFPPATDDASSTSHPTILSTDSTADGTPTPQYPETSATYIDGSSKEKPCGGGICPTSNNAYCGVHDDPHMLTFDGVSYEMQQDGVFYLYRHKTSAIWVQVVTRSCGFYSAAYCGCAAAVRYFGEAFVVDKCGTSSAGVATDVVARSGTGNLMKVNLYFAGFRVTVPGGLTVLIGSSLNGVALVDLTASARDLNMVQGLCGEYNGNPDDEFTWRNGSITSQYQQYPYDFADSWRVPAEENIFDGPTLQSIAPCEYTYNYSRVPAGAADLCYLNLQPADLSGGVSSLPQPGAGKRKKRQVAGQGFPDGQWPSGWSYANATAFCYDRLSSSATVQQCGAAVPGLDISKSISDCTRDIYLTGGIDFVGVAQAGALTVCMQQVEVLNVSSTLIADQLCLFNCSQRGNCSSGVCSCEPGWGGVYCHVDLNLPPVLQYAVPSRSCQQPGGGRSRCRAIFAFGSVFADSNRLVANATVSPSGKPEQKRSVNAVIKYYSSGIIEISIWLPFCPSALSNYSLAFSISNDGVYFSNTLDVTV